MKRFQIIAAAALVATLISGCSAQSQDSIAPAPGAVDGGIASKELNLGAAPLASDAIATADRSVIKTGSLSFETSEISTVKSKLTSLAASQQGLIENWSQESNNEGEIWSISATLRVPADKLEATIEQVSEFGKVLSTNVSNSDVTTQVLDIDARVAALQTSVDRLEKLMADAKTTADLLAAETALAQRQAELDSLLQQQKYLKDSVDMSTLYVSAFAEGRGPIAAPTSFIDGIEQGWKALTAFFAGSIVAIGIATPWLLIALPIGAIVFVVVRRVLVRRRISRD
jgi:hypothetical protein